MTLQPNSTKQAIKLPVKAVFAESVSGGPDWRIETEGQVHAYAFTEQQAIQIVTALNSHDALVAACERTIQHIDWLVGEKRYMPAVPSGNAAGEFSNGDLQRLESLVTQLRAAIKGAGK